MSFILKIRQFAHWPRFDNNPKVKCVILRYKNKSHFIQLNKYYKQIPWNSWRQANFSPRHQRICNNWSIGVSMMSTRSKSHLSNSVKGSHELKIPAVGMLNWFHRNASNYVKHVVGFEWICDADACNVWLKRLKVKQNICKKRKGRLTIVIDRNDKPMNSSVAFAFPYFNR